MEANLQGRVAIVTETVARTAKGRVMVARCDVRKAQDIASAYEQVVATLGRVDIVVNNAGTSRTGAFTSITDEVWQEDLDLKLFAGIRVTRLAWPQMVERRWGRVINVLNIGAKAPRAASAPTTVSRHRAHNPPMPRRPVNIHPAYHAHVYFDAGTVDQARALCEEAGRLFGVSVGRVHEKPVGPHPRWSCQLAFSASEFERIVPWLDQHRNGLDVFVHGLGGDALQDHTEYAYWLGNEWPLDLQQFRDRA